MIAEGQIESVCLELFGAQLARNVALSLQLSTNEGIQECHSYFFQAKCML